MEILSIAMKGIKHELYVLILVLWIVFSVFQNGVFTQNSKEQVYSFLDYGFLLSGLLILLRLLSLLALPQSLMTFIGLVAYDSFPQEIKLSCQPKCFLVIRVVTRGLFPSLIAKTVEENLVTLLSLELTDFIIQVVSEKTLGLNLDSRVEEIIVPSSYSSKSGVLNKARALQYALETTTELKDEDWIIHLDEETLLTTNSVKGILNFIRQNKHSFGQGLITYGNASPKFKSWSKFLQNRLCTVADSFRVADDMGKIRGQFKMFHRPLFGWKGSYVVAQVGSERKVNFDNGPQGSKAEDCYFAIKAWSLGYSFNFIEGEMHEKSPFTFTDFLKQRRRWMQGIYLVVTSSALPMKNKICLGLSLASWLSLPLISFNLILVHYFPFSIGPLHDVCQSFIQALAVYMYFYGFFKQFPTHNYSLLRWVFIIPELLLASLISLIVENIAVLSMWTGNWYDFYIVEKEDDDTKKIIESLV